MVDANYALNLLFQKSKINEEVFNRTMTFLSTNSCAKDPSLKINQNLVIQHESKIKVSEEIELYFYLVFFFIELRLF